MYKIVLVCQYGASTSMFAARMNAAAKKWGIDAECKAYPESRLEELIEEADFLLLGPQIGYKKDEFMEEFPQYASKFHVLNSMDFGTLNGEKVLRSLINMDKEK